VSEAFGLSLPQQIAEVLADEIVERRLPLGHRLAESSLAARFGTSRASIREALYLLAQEGLIDRSPRRGAFVRAFDRREIEELYQVRYLLEELALERIFKEPDKTRACLAALASIIEQMKRARKDIKSYHELNFKFHKAIVEVAGSALLLGLYKQIEGPLKIFLRVSFEPQGAVSQSINEHGRIFTAIEHGNAREACDILLAHDEEGMRRAITVLSAIIEQ
jgi:DNA-binding GntR family transcriptional regulator